MSLIDRIAAVAHSSLDLKRAVTISAEEVGRALGASRCAVVLLHENELRFAAEYSAPDISPRIKNQLGPIDQELTLNMADEASLKEIPDLASDPALAALFLFSFNEDPGSSNVRSVLVAPLVTRSQVIGAIIIYRARGTGWTSQEKQFVQAIASSLSLTIYHIDIQEKAKNAADRESLINSMLTAIRTADSVDKILDVAVEGVGAALGVTRAIISMRPRALNGGRMALVAHAEYRASALVPSLLGSSLDIEHSPLLARLLEGELITIPDINDSHPFVRAICVRLGVRAMALAPISYNGQMVAIFALEQFDRPREFSEEEIRLLRLAAEQTAVALYQADLYREAQEAARRDALISKISSAIHSSLDSDTVLQAIVNELGAALSVCRCRVALVPDPVPEFVSITHEYIAECCAGHRGVTQSVPMAQNPYFRAVFSSERPIAVNDISTDPRLALVQDQFKAAGVKSLLVTAIRLGGKPIGFFSLHQCEKYHTWTEWEIDVVHSVAEHAAVAIRQTELYREARESATGAALVNQLIAAIRRSLDLREMLQVAAQELGEALGASRTRFLKLEGEQVVVVAEHLTDPAFSTKHTAMAARDYTINYMLETRRTLIIDDVRAFIAAHSDLAATVLAWQVEPISCSEIICPIFVNGKFWGGLSINQLDRCRKWTASEIALVEVVTAQIEVAVSHSHLFEETKQSAEQEALISQITHGINQSNHLNEILPVVVCELGDHLAVDRLNISKLDDEEKVLTVVCEYNEGKVSRPVRVYPADLVAKFEPMIEDGIIMTSDVESDPRFASVRDLFRLPPGARALLTVCISYNGKPRLAITATMKSVPRKWSNDEVEVMRAAANQVLTALERAELFEQVSRGKYEWEATFDALSDGIFIFDQNGRLRRVNQAGAAFEGADARDLIGRRCCSLLRGVEGEECRVAEVIGTRRPITFELEPERLPRPVLVTISPLTDQYKHYLGGDDSRDGDGHSGLSQDGALGAVCIVRDLTELRAAEAAAREQRNFLVKLIERANDAIFALSAEGQFIWFNEELTKLSGYSREELYRSGYRKLIPTEEESVAIERFTHVLEGDAQTFEMQGLKKGGETVSLLITFTPIYDGGRVTSVLAVARDITEEKLASERAAQAAKLRALGQLASGVAHNFNNVLAAILGHAQLIKRDSKEERTIERIDIIERAALDGAQTVKRIQGFGQQQTGAVNDMVDINHIVQDSANLTRARWCDEARARGLNYEVVLDLQPAPQIAGSASELREVFVNIILNALDAMPQGGRLRITTEVKGSIIRTKFTDSGIGMTREVREHIFEPFFSTKGVTGMGLGLAVSYSIIERHGGRIEAHSNPGRGSCFTVTLPINKAVIRKPSRDQAAQVQAANILIIDDDERVREAVVGMISGAGHNTDQATSGRDGLEKMERERFDLVLTDLSMPEMDGWAVASEIRRRWPEVKIVLMTSYAIPPETVNHHRELVNDVILKPIRFDDISATLNDVLS